MRMAHNAELGCNISESLRLVLKIVNAVSIDIEYGIEDCKNRRSSIGPLGTMVGYTEKHAALNRKAVCLCCGSSHHCGICKVNDGLVDYHKTSANNIEALMSGRGSTCFATNPPKECAMKNNGRCGSYPGLVRAFPWMPNVHTLPRSLSRYVSRFRTGTSRSATELVIQTSAL